jgi:hypothetical protein
MVTFTSSIFGTREIIRQKGLLTPMRCALEPCTSAKRAFPRPHIASGVSFSKRFVKDISLFVYLSGLDIRRRFRHHLKQATEALSRSPRRMHSQGAPAGSGSPIRSMVSLPRVFSSSRDHAQGVLFWIFILLIATLERLRCLGRDLRRRWRTAPLKHTQLQSFPSHVALLGNEAALASITKHLIGRGVQRVTVFDPGKREQRGLLGRASTPARLVLGPADATRRRIVAMTVDQRERISDNRAFYDEPDLLLTLDGHLHGYPATALRVTHLHRLANPSLWAVDEALRLYLTTERRQGR